MSVQVRCSCGYHMELPDEWGGRQGRCPQCGKVLNIPAKRATTKPAWGPATTSGLGTLDTHPVTEPPAAADGSLDASLLKSPIWLVAVGGGLLLLALGFFLVFPGGGSGDVDTTASSPEGRSGGGPPPLARETHVFLPPIETDDDADSTADPGATAPQPKVPTTREATGSDATRGSPRPVTIATWSLRDFGVPVPPGASMIEIDGVALPVRNASDLARPGGVPLVLPLGKHIVRFAKTEPARVVEPKHWFLDEYREAAAQVQEDNRWSFDRLLELSRISLDRFSEPLVPHFWGNYYWQEGEFEAAARHYAWALEIAPTFAPSYFNLAQLAHERGDDDVAGRYLRLASLWNVQNAYGLSAALTALHHALATEETILEEDEPDWYQARHTELTRRDHDMMAVLRSSAEFAPQLSERAKILNNLGSYFEYVGKPELAVESYRSAAGVLSSASLEAEERLVIRGILENLARICRQADMPEYRRYERLKAIVH